MRWLTMVSAFLLIGCVTPEVGMTASEYKAQCKRATWLEAAEIRLSNSEAVVVCPQSGNAPARYQLFEYGTLRRIYSREEVLARLEDNRCRTFGLEVGTGDYVNCRMSLAQIRAQQEIAASQQQRQSAAMLMQYGLALQTMNQPTNVRVQTNCLATRLGNTISYNCN